MPHADPGRSFDVAVRHMFRHIDDLAMLRRNPVAKAALGISDVATVPDSATARAAALSKILDAGRVCFVDDAAAGHAAPGHRRFAILTAICAKRRPATIAREVGLSLPQFYRVRHEITHRVVRALLAQDASAPQPAASNDTFRLAMWRVDAIAAQGLAIRALAECERVAARTWDPTAKATAIFKLGDLALQLGDTDKARESLDIARRLGAQVSASEIRRPSLDVRAFLFDYRLAMHEGDQQAAHQAMASLRSADKSPSQGDDADDDLRIEILLEQARFAAAFGDIGCADDSLARASTIARHNAGVTLDRRVQIAVFAATFAEECRRDPAIALLRLVQARDMARVAGSAMGVLFASIALTNLSAALNDRSQARSYAQHALQLARTMDGDQALLFTVASVAPLLTGVQRWTELEAAVEEVESAASPLSDLWTNLRLSRGMTLARCGRTAESLEPLGDAVDGARNLHKPRTESTALREFALALHSAGRRDDARDCIKSALALAQSCNDSPEMRRNRAAAAKILPRHGLASSAP